MTKENLKSKVQSEALQEILKFRRSGVNLSPGMGKTLLGLKYLDTVKGKTLVLVPKVSIIESWVNDSKKFNYLHVLNEITFSTYLSLHKHDLSQFQNIIADEAHSIKEKYDEFLKTFQGNFLGLTGTPPKDKFGEKGRMMTKYYPIRYVYKTDKAVENNLLNDYRIYVHMLDLSTVRDIKVQNFYTSERQSYEWITKQIEQATVDKQKFFRAIQRINLLKQFKTKEEYAKKLLKTIPESEKCLVFANTIEQAERLCSYSYHSKSKTDYLEAFDKGIITKMSCVEQLSEGINIKDLKHGLILHTYSGSSPKTKQKFSRNLRLSVGETAHVHILCYRNSVDERWVRDVLEDFDSSKIKFIEM